MKNDLLVTEIESSIEKSDSLQEICSQLISFWETKDREDRVKYFKTVLQKMSFNDFCDDESSMNPDIKDVSDERLNELLRLSNTLISKLVERRVSEDDFYLELSNRLWDDVVLPTHEDRTAFLIFLWIDSRIPYYQIGHGIMINEDEFKTIINKIALEINKGSFIINANIPYKTQRASLLMEIANQLANDNERIVFWGVLIGRIKDECRALLSALEQRNPKNLLNGGNTSV